MIRFVEMECPNCGGNLTKTGKNTARCNHCNSDFLIDNEQAEPIVIKTNTSVHSQISPLPLFLGIILALVSIAFIAFGMNSKSGANVQTIVPVYPEATESIAEYSAFFRCFCEEVYHMAPEKVTTEQLAEVTGLQISHSNRKVLVQYTLKDEATHDIELPSEADDYSKDLKRFTSLTALDLKDLSIIREDIEGLNELTDFRSCNSPNKQAEIVPHPEKIITLASYSAENITGIDTFLNVENLTLECCEELTSIDGLSALKHLKSLIIENGDHIADFGVLQSLSTLEELSISSESLKDATFLQYLTSLRKLSIEDSILLDISDIRNLTALKDVCLDDNFEIVDFSALSNLTELENLQLELNSSTPMPSVENWNKLTSLTLTRAKSLGFLTSLPTLKTLSLSICDLSEYDVLTNLTELEQLKLSSIYGDIPDLYVLNQMKSLKSLDISDLSLYGDVEYIFGIPTLEELNISDCSFGLNFDQMPGNENLKILNMNRLEVWANIYVEFTGPITSLDYDEVNINTKIDFFRKFPNLEELYMQSTKLTDVEFTKDLPQLKKLDITDNYVTDLRPLSKLPYLDTVWCGENSISQGLDLGKKVKVISDSEGESDW